ncbi:MAG: hypothetical protein ACLS28_10230 [Clostridium neonatale]
MDLKVSGIYDKVIDDRLLVYEYGFEITKTTTIQIKMWNDN